MVTRRKFFVTSAAAAAASAAPSQLDYKQRVDRALKGQQVDRSPYSFWYHFLDQDGPGSRHAENTLNFHRKFHTDIVKVMSDYPYPKPRGEWFILKEEKNPFPEQIQALRQIRAGLAGSAYFIETLFNPWQVAEKLSSPEAVRKLKAEKPQQLLDALEVIAKSEANHSRLAIAAGAAGIFVSITNAQPEIMSQEEYAKFSEPFDKMVFDAVRSAPMNTLHLHGDHVYLSRFYAGWAAPIFHYSLHGTRVPISEVRKHYSGVIMGGFDEVNFRKLTPADLKQQWLAASREAGPKFLLAPGCSVPNDTTDAELLRVPAIFGA